MRRILFVTGIRSEYDILYSVVRSVMGQSELEAGIVVTGAHLSPLYGSTVHEIERDQMPIVGRIESLLSSDTPASRVKSAAIQLSGLVDFFVRYQPDMVVAPMDREEAITVALAGQYMQIPVIHIGGGDTAEDGNIDNAIRHAVTKLAHLHMVTTQRSAERVIALGEESWRVHVVGAPGLDRLLAEPVLSDAELWSQVRWDPSRRPFALVIQHSIISDAAQAGQLMELTLDSLVALDIPALISYPNSDTGSQQIIQVIESYAHRYPNLHKYVNFPRTIFVNLLRRAAVLIGNSSCGIIEAPLFHLPVVNIGARQRGREHSNNVEFVDHDGIQIQAAIRRAMFDTIYRKMIADCVNPYGDGRASQRIAHVLVEQPIDERLLSKRNTF